MAGLHPWQWILYNITLPFMVAVKWTESMYCQSFKNKLPEGRYATTVNKLYLLPHISSYCMTSRKREGGKKLKFERGSTRSHTLGNSLSNRPRTCRKTDYAINKAPSRLQWGEHNTYQYLRKGKNQLDATYFIIYSILIYYSTCFGR